MNLQSSFLWHYPMIGSAGADETADVGPSALTQVNSPGSSGGKRTFNGSNQRFTAADNAAFELPASGDWSLFAWFNTTTTGKLQYLVAKDTPAANREWVLSVSTGNTVNFSYSTSGTSITTIGATMVVTDGLDHLAAVTYRHSDGRLRLFVDGVLRVFTYSVGQFASTSSILTVGCRGDANAVTFFTGSMGAIGAANTDIDTRKQWWLWNNRTARTWAELASVPDELPLPPMFFQQSRMRFSFGFGK